MFGRFIAKKGFATNALILIKGSLFAQAVSFLATFFLARLYSPDQYGQLALFVSIYTVLSGVYALKLDQAIMIQGDNRDTKDLISFCIFTSCSSLAFFLLIASLIPDDVNRLERNIFFLVFFAAFFQAWMLIGHQYVTKIDKFVVSAKAKAGFPIAVTASQLLLFFLLDEGLVVGQFLGLAVISIYLICKIPTRPISASVNKGISLSKKVLSKNRNFPLFVMPNYLFNSLAVNLPNLLLAFFYGLNVAGYYLMATKLVATPMSVLTASVYQAFYRKASEDYQNGKDIYPLIRSVTKNQALIGTIPFGIVIFYSQSIFVLLLGEQWAEAGRYCSALVIWLYCVFLITPLTSVFNILGRQKLQFKLEFLGFILRFLSLFIPFKLGWSAMHSIVCFTVSGVLINILFGFIIMFYFREDYVQDNVSR